MNALYKMDSDIYLAFRLQLVCKFFFCGLVFSTAFPILYLICGAMFAAAGWIDRYNFLRVFAPPPPTSDRLITFVARVITPFAVLGHTCMSFVFFRAIDVDRETPGWSWASILSLVAVSITTPPILYFFFREHRGSRRRVEVMPGHTIRRTFREWFLGLEDDEYPTAQQAHTRGGSRWQPTMSFRETPELGYYLPPLPRTLQVDELNEFSAASFNPSLSRQPLSRRNLSRVSRQRIDWDDAPSVADDAAGVGGGPRRANTDGARRQRERHGGGGLGSFPDHSSSDPTLGSPASAALSSPPLTSHTARNGSGPMTEPAAGRHPAGDSSPRGLLESAAPPRLHHPRGLLPPISLDAKPTGHAACATTDAMPSSRWPSGGERQWPLEPPPRMSKEAPN